MCQTLDTVFQPSSHLLPSYKKYGLRLVFRWFLGFVYSCDHQTTLYKTLNNGHSPPLKSEPKKVSLHSIKYHLLQLRLSLRGGGRGFPPATLKGKRGKIEEFWRSGYLMKTLHPLFDILHNYSSHWLVYSTTLDKLKLCKLPFQCPRVQTLIWRCVRYFDLWGIHGGISRMKHCMPCLIQSVFTHVASIYANLLTKKKAFA